MHVYQDGDRLQLVLYVRASTAMHSLGSLQLSYPCRDSFTRAVLMVSGGFGEV